MSYDYRCSKRDHRLRECTLERVQYYLYDLKSIGRNLHLSSRYTQINLCFHCVNRIWKYDLWMLEHKPQYMRYKLIWRKL